ncbi:MAG: hypothetical protein QF807_02670 [Candidatus Thalassarchaeaceae archaeon]|nr:hypothetical protein [Candidatus Thalassarchaeaceae archaeon]
MSGDVNRNNIPSILVMIFILASLAPMLNFASEEAEASGGTRHVYTFIDGTTEAIAVYHSGQTATNVKVALPRGAEVTAVEMTLSGASSTGWNQIQHSSRSEWMSGTTVDTDKRSDSVSLGIDTPSHNFSTHGVNDESTSGGAWLDNSSFSIRQPRTSNASETRFTPQTTISSPFATYGAGATLNYRGWTYVSTFSGTNLNQLVKKTHPNNLTTATTVKFDEGSCNIPSPTAPTYYSYYGFRDWTIGDDEKLYAILGLNRQYTSISDLVLVVMDIRYEDVWTCLNTYDISTNSFGPYTGISYDRSRDVIWVLHSIRKSITPYTFNSDGTFDRDTNMQYDYFSSYSEQNGLVANNNMFFFRSKYNWAQDRLEAYAISGTSTTLVKQTGERSISANGFGIYYNGERISLIDHYQWSARYYREYGTGWAYPISPQPGTSSWISEPIHTNSDVLVANVETSWSVTSAGDRVDYWVSADNGTHWVQVTNNETVHFANPGDLLRWKIQLVGGTAVSWWLSLEYGTEYSTSGTWTSPTIPTGTQVGTLQPQWTATTPTGTSLTVEVSNDNGTNWHSATNNQLVELQTQGNRLKYRVSMSSTDSSISPMLESFSLDYEEGYPTSVHLDIGHDNINEYTGTGLLNQPIVIDGQELVDAFNLHILDNGVGVSNVTLGLSAGSPGRIMVSNLDITYRMNTRALDIEVEGNMLVPDGENRVLLVRVAKGDEADRITQVQVELQANGRNNSVLQWQSGNVCDLVSNDDNLVRFDAANCTSSTDNDGILSILMPMRSTWEWDDESNVEAKITVDDDLGRQVNKWLTENLDMKIENDIALINLGVTDENGRVLEANDWVRGGLQITFQGGIVFEETTYTPSAGQFSIELTGQNLSLNGEPEEPEKQFHLESNPSHGQYSLTITSPIESSQGGMLFRIKAVNMQNGSNYVNPDFNSVKIVLDGNSPLVIDADPTDNSERHKGSPEQPVRIVVQDSVDPPTQLTLHYWRQGQDDLNYDQIPNENEYVTLLLRTPELQPGGLNIFEGLITDSMNEHGEKVSFFLSGADAQGNELAMGGGPVCLNDDAPCGDLPSQTEPCWDCDLVTYQIREEFEPMLVFDGNTTIVGHDDDGPLHPGTIYTANLRVWDNNGWNDINNVKIALGDDIDANDTAIWANFTKLNDGNLSMHLESGSSGLAVSNLYSSFSVFNDTALDLNIQFQLTWLFPESWDTNGVNTFLPIVEIADWPCNLDELTPCFEHRNGLGNDRWSLDNDLRFDMSPGHFTAIDLATGRNLYNGGDEQETIAAGQVVRVNGRILFSEDETPAPEGAFDIVVGNLELEWRAVPREGGEFTTDILVPNVRSGHLDMLAWLENLPGLAGDETEEQPRILLEVDGNSPVINAILPFGDITIADASSIDVFVNSSDDHGFIDERKAVIHYKVKAGESEVSRGSKELGTLLEQYGYGHWTGVVDLTDGGVTELLPGYVVDIWITGADAAGNPYVSENNTESTPLTQWQIIRVGPVVELMELEVLWSDATPVSGENVTLDIAGTNQNGEEGTLTFALQQKTKDGDWINVHNASTDALLRANGDFVAAISISTEEVDEETVERYRLVVKDSHIVLDRMSLDPLILQPPVARDGQAISEQFSEQTGTVLLYVALMVALIAIVVLIVMNRKLLSDELDPADQTIEVASEMGPPPPPPPGFKSEKPPPPPSGYNPDAVRTEPPPPPSAAANVDSLVMSEPEPSLGDASTGTESQWTDEMLLGQGWTQWQVDTWRAQQNEGDTNVAQTTTSSSVQSVSDAPLPANHPAANFNFSDAVVAEMMEKYEITDKSAFLTHAIDFDSNANNYLSSDELEQAAKSFSEQ